MFGIGIPELILILAIALIVIGPKKLPDLAKSIGKALGEFKRATTDLKDSLERETDISEVKKAFRDLNTGVRDTIQKGMQESDTRQLANADSKTAEPDQSEKPPEIRSGTDPIHPKE
jgi:Tat protein translocase TatB subunit